MSVGSEGRSHGAGEEGFNRNQCQISCNNTAGEMCDETSAGLNLHRMNYMLKAVKALWAAASGCPYVVTTLPVNNTDHWFLLRWIFLITNVNM